MTMNQDVVGLTIAQASILMAQGELTAVQLTQAYLDRIAIIDPLLHSLLETNPDALTIAGELDAERADGHVRGPLHGIPVLLKDNIDTADNMHTTAGSLALMESTPPRDATVAKQLREAGAILLGKTNLSEWANIRGKSTTSGWSARGGITRNPHCLLRSASGSSSGSAAAVAADLAMVTIGTETNGSVVLPAAACGVVGHKPTVGLTSRAGVIPISHSQDSVGVLGRSVADVATTLATLTGIDDRDPATAGSLDTDFLPVLDANALRGVRLGVPTNFGFTGYSPKADAIFERVLVTLASLGAEIVHGTDIPTADDLRARPGAGHRLLYDFRHDIDAYLAERDDPAFRTLEDLIAFNTANADTEMIYFGQEQFEQAAYTAWDDDEMAALDVRLQRQSREEGIDAVLAEHRLDALIAVTKAPSSLIDVINGEKFPGAACDLPAIAGYPIVTVPAGLAYGMPVGLSFIGTAWSDARLLGLAYAWEQATQMYRSPGFVADDIALHPETPAYEFPIVL